jgi:UDP-N-acetylglucosamine 2-epimerase (non-hydrolysing)
MKHLFIAGTRPEIIKISPLVNELNAQVLLTGQHFKKEMLDNFLPLINPSNLINLELEEFKDFQTNRYLISDLIKSRILKLDVKNVFVLGDTNTTLVGAVAAKSANKKLFFIESGLRTGDLKQIEEYNRLIVSHLADVNFCNHENNVNNLKVEGIADNKIYLTGSTVCSALNRLDISESNEHKNDFILLTLHRPENVDNEDRLRELINGLKQLNYKIIFPIHPRTRDKIKKMVNLSTEHIQITEPKNYDDFVKLIKSSKFIISDSGGLQEEAMILRKPLLIPRKYTERPEMLNIFNLLTYEISDILKNALNLIENSSTLHESVQQHAYLYGENEVINKYLSFIKQEEV